MKIIKVANECFVIIYLFILNRLMYYRDMYIDQLIILEAKKEWNNYCDHENNKIETYTEFLEFEYEYDNINDLIKKESTEIFNYTVKVSIWCNDQMIYDGFYTQNMVKEFIYTS